MNKHILQLFTLLLTVVFLFVHCQNPPEEASTETTTEMSEEETTTGMQDSETTTGMQDSETSATMAEWPPLKQGEELYISYCGICHGDDGKGDGAMADMLKIPPSDLTTIESRWEGTTFPEEEMYDIIKGGQELPGHGEGDMPVWGETFFASEGLSSQEEVDEKIGYLIDYLKTIQE